MTTHQSAIEVLKNKSKHRKTEILPLANCLHLVSADEVFAPINVPSFDNAAMDGYAFRFEDFLNELNLQIINEIQAGTDALLPLKKGEAARIFTGAPIPENGDTVILKEKVVCFWSEDFDIREKYKREELEIRIKEFIDNPSKYNSSNKVGIKKYLKLQNLDKETGEIEKIEPYIEFDKKKYDRDMRTDGYYCIITSEIELDDMSVIEKYRGLWKIEESFRVIKSDLEGRPIYVWTESHIEGHFLICFLALLIIRILELKTKHRFSVKRLQESLATADRKSVV